MPAAKVALVTGAGRGIGRDIALRIAKEGYAVGLIARTKSQLDETAELIRAQGGKAVVTPTDVSRREQVVAAVETVERELGPISVLINNAGAYLRKRFVDISEEDFDFQLKVNAYGPFFCTQAVVGKMAERKSGTIIFVLGVRVAQRSRAIFRVQRIEAGAARDRGVGRLRVHASGRACCRARR